MLILTQFGNHWWDVSLTFPLSWVPPFSYEPGRLEEHPLSPSPQTSSRERESLLGIHQGSGQWPLTLPTENSQPQWLDGSPSTRQLIVRALCPHTQKAATESLNRKELGLGWKVQEKCKSGNLISCSFWAFKQRWSKWKWMRQLTQTYSWKPKSLTKSFMKLTYSALFPHVWFLSPPTTVIWPHTHTVTHIHTLTHKHSYTHSHRHTHFTQTYTHIDTHPYTHSHRYTHTHSHTHSHRRTLTHTHSQTHTFTQTHILTQAVMHTL